MKIFIVVGISFLLFVGCTKAIIDEGDVSTLPPIQTTIRYNPDVQNIMFNHCTTCHGGPAPNAGLDLSTYQNVRNSTENGNLLDRVNDALNPMPPIGLLSPTDRQILDKWVQDGYLEN